MEGEMKNCLKVWIAIFVSLSYCHAIGKLVPKGTKRLAFVLPIVCLFLYLPLNLYSINCGGITGFFISWLTNFKLLLFAFGKGPLSSDDYLVLGTSNTSLARFIAYACLPIEIRENTPQNPSSNRPKKATKSHSKGGRSHESPSPRTPKQRQTQKWLVIYATKCVLLTLLVLRFSHYKQYLHYQKAVLFFYCLYIYLVLDVILAATSAAARAVSGAELEPHFDEPYLATSLQDFWGRRWNLAVSRALRPTVYEPSLAMWARFVGRRWAPIPAVMATFVVSGLMHELIYYYWARVWPTWEVTWFFLVHGLCLMVEIALKKALGGGDTWRPPKGVVGPLTVAFVMESCFRLMFPQLIRCEADVRLLQEYAAIRAFFRNIIQKLSLKPLIR